ncbi:sensor histidine kinase [Halorussus marinus]|uniref:sensor histidine kinase n=1 Tax=Halorussus marinus TaxID=2505976 RepID=UPI0010925820|nr:PAS domain-containing sensor histidine kinase [Halorussus marinus]
MSDERTIDEGVGGRDLELYRELIENSNDVAAVLDRDGTVTFVSATVERVLGYEPDELVGENAIEYLHRDDREAITEKTESLRADPDEARTVEVRFERADGSWCWLESTMRNRLDHDAIEGILVNSRDITERKERERNQRKLAEEYRALLDTSGDAIFLLDVESVDGDTEFRFVQLSSGYETQTGLTTEEVKGKTPREVFGEERGAELEANYQNCVDRRKPISYQEELSIAEDARFWQTNLAPVVVEGEIVRIVGIARNVTDRVERERELRRKNDRLDEFASVVSHDVRNPLNVAQGRAALLRAEFESDHLEPLARSLDRIESIIEDTLVLAREGAAVGDTEPVSLTDLLGCCWGVVDFEDGSLEIEDDLTVRGDPDRLRHVFENLFHNAAEHAGEDVTVRVGRDGPRTIYVEDDGRGIPADRRSVIFEPGESSSADGTGFGLSIVKRIAEAHGWTVTATEERTGGARFEFRNVEIR